MSGKFIHLFVMNNGSLSLQAILTMINSTQKDEVQGPDISSGWEVVQNVFFDIDLSNNISEKDKDENICSQEDLLYLTKGNYHLDLGWYGSDDLTNDRTGYCIHLFRGNNWNNGELLEKFRSKEKQVTVTKINELIHAVDRGDFDKLTGYIVNDKDPTNNNDFCDLDNYTAR